MLKLNNKAEKVEAVLCMDMLIAGEECSAGEVVEMSARDLKYFLHFDRVLPATKENVAAVKAQAEAKARAAQAAAARADELTATRNELATALARIAELEGKSKGK
jgi:hypothetical protein